AGPDPGSATDRPAPEDGDPWSPDDVTDDGPPEAAPVAGECIPSAPAPGVPDPRTPADTDVPNMLDIPDAPESVADGHPGFIGDRPPTYDAEPTALPAADPERLGEPITDTVVDGARYGTWTLRAASVRGDSARYRGDPRKDALLTARFGTGDGALVLIAVATGPRVAPDAHRTAADACRLIGGAVGRSHARLSDDIRADRREDLGAGLHRLTDRVVGRLRADAAERGADDPAVGLRCLLLTADPRCRNRIFFGIGPGGLFRLRDGSWEDIEPAVPPAGPRDDDGPADPPAPPYEPFRFRACAARPGDTLLLCGPGFADPLREAPGLGDELARRWHPGGPPGLAGFLADVQLRVKGYADDRTAVAVHDTPG
ncbi:protein phosphatase 2C domain-containing protein, partial [Streptomyces sp. NPDC058953]